MADKPSMTDYERAKERISPNLRAIRPEKATPYPQGMVRPPSYKKGGVVKATGLAKVHKGERIIPAKAKKRK